MASGQSLSGYEDLISYTSRNWTKNNKFWVEFSGNTQSGKVPEVLDFLVNNKFKKIIATSIIDINLFDTVTDPIERYINEQYVMTQGRIQSAQISVKFRDYDQAYLYKRCHQAFYALNREYMSDSKVTISVYLDPDWTNDKRVKIAEARNCIFNSLGGLTLDYGSQNQFLEFNVTFKTPKIHFDPSGWTSIQPKLKASTPIGF